MCGGAVHSVSSAHAVYPCHVAITSDLAAAAHFKFMNEQTGRNQLTAIIFFAVFFLAAAVISYQLLRRNPDYLTLTINNEWRVYLIDESNIYAVEYRADNFVQQKIDSHHLWLQGFGDIQWHHNRILVTRDGVYFNDKFISKSPRPTLANILFARDGTVRKELLEPRPDK